MAPLLVGNIQEREGVTMCVFSSSTGLKQFIVCQGCIPAIAASPSVQLPADTQQFIVMKELT